MDNVSDAWAEVSIETLKRAWNKLWPEETEVDTDQNEYDVVTNEILASTSDAFSLESQNEIVDWLRCDSQEIGYQLLTDAEIIDMANEEETNIDSEAETDIENDGSQLTDVEVTVADKDLREEAKNAAFNIQKFIDWYIQQEDANPTDLVLLRRMRSFATKKSEKTVKQTTLTSFFKSKP